MNQQLFKFIPTFEPYELNYEKVTLRVVEDNGIIVIMAINNDGVMYVLNVAQKEAA